MNPFKIFNFKGQYHHDMKTILVASDFSEEAQNATEYAIAAAKYGKAKIIIFHLHVISVHAVNARLSFEAIQQSLEAMREKVEQRVERLSKAHQIILGTDWAMGDFHEEIQKAIDRHHADILVMGMHGKSLEQDLLGSTTTAAINKLDIPILAVPLGAKFHGIKKILFAFDVEKGVEKCIMEKVKMLSKVFDAEVELFHVGQNLGRRAATMAKELEDITYYYKNVESDGVIQAIRKEIQAVRADLLVMVPYSYGFWGSMVHRSKTRMMATGLDVPLLSLHV